MNDDEVFTKEIEKRGELRIRPINYRLGKHPHKLKHRKLSVFEQLFNKSNGFHCQICRRSNNFVAGWWQIDDPENTESNEAGGSVVCDECHELNPEIFGKSGRSEWEIKQCRRYLFSEFIHRIKLLLDQF